MTLTLPVQLSGTSGINAIAHCAEALYSRETNPILQLMAEEGIRALGASLPVIARQPDNMPARCTALYGAWLAGTCLSTAGVALHHKLCHTLGGACELPHAETNAVVLPYALAYNSRAAPEALAKIVKALGADNAPAALLTLAKAFGAAQNLQSLGMRESDIEKVTKLVIDNPYWNPEPVSEQGIRVLLHNAYWGIPPATAPDTPRRRP